MNKVGKRIKQLREERDMTMDLMVHDLNTTYDIEIHKSNISRWESGQTDPSLKHAVILAEYFNVSLDYLIGLTDVRTPARLLAYMNGIAKMKGNNEQ